MDTLEYLVRGGRVGQAAAFAGDLLNVKPILAIYDGEVEPVKRVRGRPKAVPAFEQRFAGAPRDGPGLRVGVAAADAQDGSAGELAARTRARGPRPRD